MKKSSRRLIKGRSILREKSPRKTEAPRPRPDSASRLAALAPPGLSPSDPRRASHVKAPSASDSASVDGSRSLPKDGGDRGKRHPGNQ